MKKIIVYSYMLFVAAIAIVSCRNQYDVYDNWPEWPTPSSPEVGIVSVTDADGNDLSSVNAGSRIRAYVEVFDRYNDLVSVEITCTLNGTAVNMQTKAIEGRNAEASFDMLIPFSPYMDDGAKVGFRITVCNNYKGETVYELPEEKQLTVLRPEMPEKLYLVDCSGNVVEMLPEEDNPDIYTTVGDVSAVMHVFKIASRVSGSEIDYSGLVWGSIGGETGIVYTDVSDPISVDIPYGDIPESYSINVYSFAVSFALAPLKISRDDFSVSEYPGYLSAEVVLTNSNDVVFEGFPASAQDIIDRSFFSSVSGNQVKFMGQSGKYSLLYNETNGFIYIENKDMRYPDAMWVCGAGLGFAQKPYKKTIEWNWNKPSDYVFMNKVSDDVFEAIVFVDSGFGFKFFRKRGWGTEDEELSQNYTLFPDGVMAVGNNGWDDTGDCVEGPAFEGPGVYILRISLKDKIMSLERLP